MPEVDLAPAGFKLIDTIPDKDIKAVRSKMNDLPDALARYAYLSSVKADKPGLFYAALQRLPQDFLPVVYTPGVGEACRNWGTLDPRPNGLTLSIADDAGKVASKLRAFVKDRNIQTVVVTDGNRILGLGDLGANGMGISVGKTYLYNAAGGLHPNRVLPVVLDVGCGNEELRASERYVGKDMDRVKGERYFDFVDEFHSAVQQVCGDKTLIHWEDFGSGNAAVLLKRYRARGPTFNDDIQSTAAVALAALIGACRADAALPLTEQRFMFLGAGQAGLGIGELVIQALEAEGVDAKEARARIWMLDSKGVLGEGRDMPEDKAAFAQSADALKAAGVQAGAQLLDAVKAVKPTCLLGCAGKGGLFTKDVLRAMSAAQPRVCPRSGNGASANGGGECDRAKPIILALSNPTDLSECSFQDAWDACDGHVVFAGGSPFPPVDTPDGPVYASQANNALIYPGLGAAAVLQGASSVPDSLFLAAAHALADETSEDERAQGLVLPPIRRIRDAALAVSTGVAKQSSVDMVATNRGERSVFKAAAAAAQDSGEGSSENGSSDAARVDRLRDAISDWRF